MSKADITHQVNKTVTTKGFTIVNVKIPNYPISTTSFWVDAGSRNDPLKKLGLAHLFEHLLFNNTSKYSTRLELLEAIEEKGMLFNAFTGLQAQQYFLVHPASTAETALEILTEGLANSTFNKKDLEREKKIVLQEATDNALDVSSYIWRLANKGLFGEEKLGKDFYGNEITISSINIDDIHSFYAKNFISDRITFVFLNSPLSEKEQISIIDRVNLPQKTGYSSIQQITHEQTCKQVIFEQRNNTDQVQLAFSILGPPLSNIKDRVVQDLIASYLASGWISKLIQKLRLQNNYCYWVYQDTAYLSDTGYQRFTLSTAVKNVSQVIQIVLNEFIELPNLDKFDAHKTKYLADLDRNMVDYTWLMNWYGYLSLPQNELLDLQTYTEMISTIQPEDVKQFCEHYISNSKIALAYIYKRPIKVIDTIFRLPLHK